MPAQLRRRRVISTLALAVALALPAWSARGQTPSPPPAPAATPPRAEEETGACFGFAFGKWTPPLDWRAAGHDRVDTAGFIHAPEGRDWAADLAAAGDTLLMLFPVWWPAGVAVEVPTRRLAVGDTVTGKAVALVGDGRVKPPTAPVRAWRVRCAERAGPPTRP